MSASLEKTEASSAGKVDTVDDDDDDKRQEIWYREDERWELTWPIWHMLSRDEKKSIASKHGYTIGDFEEYMSLQQAVGDTMQQNQKPYENSLIYPVEEEDSFQKSSRKVEDAKPAAQDRQEEDDEDDSELEEEMESERVAAVDRLPTEELVALGGKILMLPDELLHRVFDFLPVDQYATLALVSPHWKSFTRTETVYKRLCERLYLQQSKRRALHVSRFGNSYRTMLENRPRVRAGGGVYVIKYSKVKKIQRDMWTEVSPRVALALEFPFHSLTFFLTFDF
jgi:F-box protein 9